MGRRGPRPLPTALKALSGTLQPCRTNEFEPDPCPGRPDPPEFLDEVAREEWDRLVPELDRRGLIEEIDLAVVTAYCTAWSLLQTAQRAICIEGPVVIDHRGVVVASPYVRLAERARAQLIAASRELGLSASARSTVKAAPEPLSEEDARIDALLAKRTAGWQ